MPEADASPLHSGLFLDLDGTLADSVTALKNVYHSFLASFGANGDEVEFQRLNGPPLGEIIERLRMAHKLPGTPADLLQKYSAMVSQAQQSVRPVKIQKEAAVRAGVSFQHQGFRQTNIRPCPNAPNAFDVSADTAMLSRVAAWTSGWS